MAHIYNSQLDAYSLYHQQQQELSPSSSITGGPALPALGHALAGSAGTAISNLCIYPLDLIITRLQVQRQLRKSSSTPDEGEYKGVFDAAAQIYSREGGITGFYTGIVQDTGKSIADSFLFFLFYNYLRENRLQKHGLKTTTLPVLDELAVGALAGACSKFFTTPIANIVTRKQTASMLSARSSSTSVTSGLSVAEIAQEIRDEKGLQGFWSGYSASLVLTLNPSLTFFLYETFKRTLLPRSQRDDPGARMTFLMAAVSKAIASSITYPFSLAKARAQTSSRSPEDREELKADASSTVKAASDGNKGQFKNESKKLKSAAKRSTVFSTILRIYREEGASALYEGIWGEIFKGFFSHGITMIVKEAVHKVIIQTYFMILRALKKAPSPSEVMDQVGSKAQEVYGQAGDIANSTGETVGNTLSGANETAKTLVDDAKYRLGDHLSVVGKNTSQAVEKANDLVSKEAGHLLGNAQEQLGKGLDNVGNGVRPLKVEK